MNKSRDIISLQLEDIADDTVVYRNGSDASDRNRNFADVKIEEYDSSYSGNTVQSDQLNNFQRKQNQTNITYDLNINESSLERTQNLENTLNRTSEQKMKESLVESPQSRNRQKICFYIFLGAFTITAAVAIY